jgi:hypothetical protein
MIGLLQNNGRAGRSDWRTLKLTAVDDSPNLLSISIGAAARQQLKNSISRLVSKNLQCYLPRYNILCWQCVRLR